MRENNSWKAHDKDNLSDDHSDAVTVAISELRTHCDKEERKNPVDRRAYHSQNEIIRTEEITTKGP